MPKTTQCMTSATATSLTDVIDSRFMTHSTENRHAEDPRVEARAKRRRPRELPVLVIACTAKLAQCGRHEGTRGSHSPRLAGWQPW